MEKPRKKAVINDKRSTTNKPLMAVIKKSYQDQTPIVKTNVGHLAIIATQMRKQRRKPSGKQKRGDAPRVNSRVPSSGSMKTHSSCTGTARSSSGTCKA